MRKILLFILAITLMFGMFPTNTYAITSYDEAGEYLMELSIIKGDENGDLKPMSNLTREESITILVRMLNQEQNALKSNTNSGFSDIPADHWSAKYITYAKAQGLTNGVSATKFGLQENVTTKQFVTLMLRALKHSADWSKEDIMKKAKQLGLLEDSSALENEVIKRGEVFIIMKNTLDTEVNGTDQDLVDFLKKPNASPSKPDTPTKPTPPVKTPDSDNKYDKKTSLNARSANVEFILTDANQAVKVDADDANYFISADPIFEDNHDITIMGLNSNVKDPSSLPVVKIYMPENAFNYLQLNLFNSRVKVNKLFKAGKIEGNFSVSNVYVELPDEFKGELEFSISSGSNLDLVSQDKFKDGTFSINSIGTVNLPDHDKNDTHKNRHFVHTELNVSSHAVVNVK